MAPARDLAASVHEPRHFFSRRVCEPTQPSTTRTTRLQYAETDNNAWPSIIIKTNGNRRRRVRPDNNSAGGAVDCYATRRKKAITTPKRERAAEYKNVPPAIVKQRGASHSAKTEAGRRGGGDSPAEPAPVPDGAEPPCQLARAADTSRRSWPPTIDWSGWRRTTIDEGVKRHTRRPLHGWGASSHRREAAAKKVRNSAALPAQGRVG